MRAAVERYPPRVERCALLVYDCLSSRCPTTLCSGVVLQRCRTAHLD